MIDETALGVRDGTGNWVPSATPAPAPLFQWPPRPVAIARWFVTDYLLSWQLLYFGVAALIWWVATPSRATMTTLGIGWIALIAARNLVIVIVWYGLWHRRLYVRRAQDTRTKYNAKWPRDSRRFTLGSQHRDNVLWTLASGVPVMTAFEVIGLWLFARGSIPWLGWAEHPVWIVVIMLAIPLWREVHFFAIHRLIHVPALYKPIHSLHHRNVNPSPWSGLSMHPVEHALYFSAMTIHWIVPSHPLHMLFTQMHLAMAPVPGHSGFEEIEIGGTTLDTHGFAHYLHHRYFEVNYGDGAIPLDQWFGSFNDGSPAAMTAMRKRRPTVTPPT
ncbi:MAG: sterol desaturase family protein [Desertimonas sp.]